MQSTQNFLSHFRWIIANIPPTIALAHVFIPHTIAQGVLQLCSTKVVWSMSLWLPFLCRSSHNYDMNIHGDYHNYFPPRNDVQHVLPTHNHTKPCNYDHPSCMTIRGTTQFIVVVIIMTAYSPLTQSPQLPLNCPHGYGPQNIKKVV